MNENMKNQIKSGFDANSKKAPTDLWASISSAVDLEGVESTIKDSFDHNQKVAPEGSWNAIRRGVIIDEVWDRIQVKDRRRKVGFFWWSSLGAVILLLGIIAGINSADFNQENAISEEIDQSNIELSDKGIIEKNDDDLLDEKHEESVSIFEEMNSSIVSDDSPQVIENDNVQINSTSIHIETDNQIVNEENNSDEITQNNSDVNNDLSIIENISLTENDNPITFLDKPGIEAIVHTSLNKDLSLHVIDPVKPAKHPRFEIGIMAGLNNTWIMNNDVKFGFRSESLIRNRISLGYNAGLTAQLNFNARNSIAIAYDILSKKSQRYDMFADGQLHNFNIDLKQQKIGLMYKHNFIRKPYQKNYFTIRSGLFVSHSNQSTFSSSLNDTNGADLEKYDFGLKFSAGYEHSFKKLSFEYGLQSDAGILNITSESGNFLKKFEHTNTYLLGVYASLRYKF